MKAVRSFIIVIISLFGLLFVLFLTLFIYRFWIDIQHRNEYFYVDVYNQYCDGRMVVCNFENYNTDIIIPDSILSLSINKHSEMIGIQGGHDLISSKYSRYPVCLHRISGHVDTIYTSQRGRVGVGYVCRMCYTGKWLVIESKMPYMILGNNYFADIDNRHKPLMPIDYLMSHYTYEGQRIVFESPKSYFWLFNRTSPDIYGPYTMNQLREQLIRQGILLPITLQGLSDWYVEEDTHDIEQRFEESETVSPTIMKDKTKPEDYYYPNQTKRPDIVIN